MKPAWRTNETESSCFCFRRFEKLDLLRAGSNNVRNCQIEPSLSCKTAPLKSRTCVCTCFPALTLSSKLAEALARRHRGSRGRYRYSARCGGFCLTNISLAKQSRRTSWVPVGAEDWPRTLAASPLSSLHCRQGCPLTSTGKSSRVWQKVDERGVAE